MAAPTQFAFRTSRGIGVVDAAPVYESLPGFIRPEGHLRCCAYSPDGRYFAWATQDKVHVVDASVGHIVSSLNASKVFELGFSPLGTYIITWQQPSRDENGDAVKNLKVWNVLGVGSKETEERDESDIVGRFVQKSQTNWNLQYTHDEKYCARAVTNEIQFYESGDLSKVWNKLRVEGVSDFAVAPGNTNCIAVFSPTQKGQPASVKVFNVPQFSAPASQKSFFKGDKVQFKWNSQGTSVIVKAETEADSSGKSYYGETTLYLLSANGEFGSRIDLDKEGPIYDVAWNPSGKEFAVVYGFVPAKTTIFNSKATATHSFPLGPRNTLSYSPHGRFLIVGGFGSMAGQMDVYDLEKDYEKIASIDASSASICDWSPDGKHILTAVARLKVDNAIKIFHVAGGLMYYEAFPAPIELYQVAWRPQSSTHLPLTDPLNPTPAPHASALAYLSTIKTPSKPAGAYRPPGARGTTTPLSFMREDQGGAAFVRDNGSSLSALAANGFKPRRREVPGAEVADAPGAAGVDGDSELSKAALKNKKKREAKKAKDAAEKTAGLVPDGVSNHQRARSASRSPERRNRDRSENGERRDGRDYQRNRSRNNSELRPHNHDRNRSQNRSRGNSQGRNGGGGGGEYRNGPRGGQGQGPRGKSPGPNRQPNNSNHIDTDNVTSPPPSSADKRPMNPQIDIAKAAEVGATPDLTVTTPGGSTPHDKKVRALTKKLRAIDDLKMRRANGEVLEGTQIKKMDTEEAVRRELEGLGWKEE